MDRLFKTVLKKKQTQSCCSIKLKKNILQIPLICTVNQYITIFVFVEAVILGLAVYASDSTLSTEIFRTILRIFVYCLAACTVFFTILRMKSIAISSILLVIVPISYQLLIFLHRYTVGELRVLSIILLIVFLLLKPQEKKRVFEMYRYYIILMACFGIFFYIINITGIPFPHRIVPYYWGNYTDYTDYGLTYIIRGGTLFARVCGLFNEPGFFGTILAFMLCADEINLQKKENKILFIAGITTFSLAFLLIIFIYIILLNYKNIKILPIIMGVLALYIIILPNLNFDIENGSSFLRIIGRLRFENGNLIGNNRLDLELEKQLEMMFRSGIDWLFGYGSGYCKEFGITAVSYKTYLLEHGIIGMLIVYGAPLISALFLSKGNRYAFFFIIIFFVSAYQRPHIFTLPFFVVLFGGIEFICSNQRYNNKWKLLMKKG